ncbi:MAG: hypothetical protein IKK74_10150 [Clostridia bacterium]|nr:hypothetical protein [Clostridia bacterium]
MKRIIATAVALVMALTLLSAFAFNASASNDYSIEFNFLETSTYESSLVYCNGMKPAGNSTQMGYKGWLGSKNAEGATSVFVFDAGAGNAFLSLIINYRGYSIAAGEPDHVRMYVSAVGESDFAAGYTESNWTLVASIINDATAGNGINVADPTNRDPEVLRSVDVSPYILGQEKVYLRIDFFRGDNIDGIASTYFAPAGAVGTLLYENTAATEPETTAAPVVTEPETTKAPETQAPETQAPVTEPETEPATEPVTEAPSTAAPITEAPKSEGGCGGMIACGAAVVAMLGIAIVSKKRD